MLNSIEVRDAKLAFGKDDDRRIILNGLNLNVARGSIYSLIGASGCGKTTLLSCILGMKKLENGRVNVLGHEVAYNKPTKVGHLIGYMPQDTALGPELSIRETLHYFGNIFQMNKKELNERYEMIKDLLELPFENRRIENLSGGEKRRVSLAATIIHNPLILILDEPTVGLDALLREKIWNFIINMTKNNGSSVIITTHYISEAQQANRCGMMRDGVLLTEDTPNNILSRYNAETLDDAFLNLCLLKKRVRNGLQDESNLSAVKYDETINLQSIDVSHSRKESLKKRKKFQGQTMKALLNKELICLMQHKAENFFKLTSLFVLMLVFCFGPGRFPKDLKLGIINKEVIESSNCELFLSENASYLMADRECIFNHASCHFINEIRDDDAIKIYYKSFDDAFNDAKKGKIIGFVTLQSNFSEALMDVTFNFSAESIPYSEISVNLDQSDLQFSSFIQNRLFNAYQRFTKKMFKGCDVSEKISKYPLNVDTFYGSLDDDFKKYMMSNVFLVSAYIQTIAFALYNVAQSRVDGIWDRTLLAGVETFELLFAQAIFSFVFMLVSCFSGLMVMLIALDLSVLSILWPLLVLCVSICITGTFIGILLSLVARKTNLTVSISFGGAILGMTLCGLFWPIEGQPIWLQYFTYSLPIILPTLSLSDVIMKGYGVMQPSVYHSLILCLVWTFISIIITHFVIKKKKFADSD